MNLYNKIVQVYDKSITNLFTISGNYEDYTISDNSIKNKKNLLLTNLNENNHVMHFSPSEGLQYFDQKDKEEFYSLDEETKSEHIKAFGHHFSKTKYNINSGMHAIKVMYEEYRKMRKIHGNKVKNLIIFIDYADIVFPIQEINKMGSDEKMVTSNARSITSNPDFKKGNDILILAVNSYYSLNEEIRNLQNNYNISEELPKLEERLDFIEHVNEKRKLKLNKSLREEIAIKTAGLNLITLFTMLKKGKKYIKENLSKDVSQIIANSLGKHIEILHPRYGFDTVIGYEKLKAKARTLIKRMYSKNPWKGLAYVGPTGSGKDFQTEAFLFEANIPILKLKTIKSKWYGETAIILEKIKQVARSFDKVVIFKSEADKLFPDPEAKDSHQSDQEMAGLFLDWMSDSRDTGKIFWVFNTSRPQMFPVDFQRRIEIKLPILDIVDEDERFQFISKMFEIKGIDIKSLKIEDERFNRIQKIVLKEDSNVIDGLDDLGDIIGFDSIDEIEESEEDIELSNFDLIKKKIISITQDYSSDNIRMIATEVASEIEVNPDANIFDIIEDINIATLKEKREAQSNQARKFSTYKSLI